MRCLHAAVVIATAAVSLAAARSHLESQGVPAGTGVLAGRVVDASTGDPLPGATVTIELASDRWQSIPLTRAGYDMPFPRGMAYGPVVTDRSGGFRFSRLPAGLFEIDVIHPAGSGSYGQVRWSDPARLRKLSTDEQVTDLAIKVWRKPVVTGRVSDEQDRPVIGHVVSAAPAGPSPADTYFPSVSTDDRGMFTMALEPGDFYIGVRSAQPAIPQDGKPMVYLTTLYPDALTTQTASVVKLEPGDRRSGVNIRLVPTPAYRVTVTIAGAPTDRPVNVELIRSSVSDRGYFAMDMGNQAAAGRVTLNRVPPGEYRLWSAVTPQMPFMSHGIAPLKTLPPEPTLWGDTRLAVTDRDVDASLTLAQGGRLSGRVSFNGNAPSMDKLEDSVIVIESADHQTTDLRGLYPSTSTFTTIQIPPGGYFIRAYAPYGWYLNSITAGGRDVTDAIVEVGTTNRDDLEISFSDRPANIRGTVTIDPSEELFRPFVTIFPIDRSLWTNLGLHPTRMARVQAGATGRYEATLPPGTYFVAAGARLAMIPADIAALAQSAETVVIREGVTTAHNVHLKRNPR